MTANPTPLPPEGVTLEPCRECGAPCRVETFPANGILANETSIWLCSQHALFGGQCLNDQGYLSADSWNARIAGEKDVEQIALEWLRSYAEERHGEHPNDVPAYGVDEMVDAFMAGRISVERKKSDSPGRA
jgi:hypothetical protein